MEKGKKGLSWLVFLKLGKFKLDCERGRMIFDRGILAYFIFLASAAVGLVAILFFTRVPYLRFMANEKSVFNRMIDDFERPRS